MDQIKDCFKSWNRSTLLIWNRCAPPPYRSFWKRLGEIADTQAVYRCLCENTGLSTEQKEKLATLEQPLQAIRDRWRQTHPTPEPELLEACEALTTSQQQSEETPALSMTL